MKYNLFNHIIALLMAFFFVTASGCGPKEIGEGSSTYTPPSPGGQPTAEVMRYPLTGANPTQKMLYQSNRPEIMEMTQKIQRNEFNHKIGLLPDPEEEAYREIPQQRSPFRQ